MGPAGTVRLRTLLVLGGVLAVLSSLAYAGQQRSASIDPVISTVGPPSLAAQPLLGAAPSPAPAADPAGAVTTPRVSSTWVARTATRSGIPAAAVTAYGAAVLAAPPSCRLGWTTLAGIGWVESQHGTIGGRVLGADGRPSTPIIGPALDGSAFAAVPATAQTTALHGDPVWDHAVGPLQFLPSTWERWGRDGDGDGVVDPQDIDDAAAAAAVYLCATQDDLSTGSGWSAAVFAYNHSDSYVRQVYAAASAYAARTSEEAERTVT